MVVLRGTKKVLRYLPAVIDSPGESTTALGDWYANRLVVARQPILLLVSAQSLLAVLVPARDVRGFPRRMADVIAARLLRLGVKRNLVESEARAMASVAVAKTRDKSVLGTMNDFARLIPFYMEARYNEIWSLETAEAKLAETPCRVTKGHAKSISPDLKTLELLDRKWAGGVGVAS